MSITATKHSFDWDELLANVITEDDEPVDNIPSATQQRLLVAPLYDSWTPPPNEDEPDTKRKFFATANVGLFSTPGNNPLVPDMLLSLDVETPFDWEEKINRSYFIWHFGKPPDVVVEIVSNKEGHELDSKLKRYPQLDVLYYVVYDPKQLLSNDLVRVYERGFVGRRYRRRTDLQLPEINLSLTLWEGTYEDSKGLWLRWCDAQGNVIPTGAERAEREAERAEREAERAEREAERAEREAERAEREAERAVRAEFENAQLQAELAKLRAQLASPR